MAVDVKEGYPYDLTEEVFTEIMKLQYLVRGHPSHVETSARIALIDIGLSFLQKRMIEHVKDNTENQLIISERQNKSSLRLSKVALTISIIVLVATVVFSLLDYFSDMSWQSIQIETLESIKALLSESRP